jgi:hypothetical protein
MQLGRLLESLINVVQDRISLEQRAVHALVQTNYTVNTLEQ